MGSLRQRLATLEAGSTKSNDAIDIIVRFIVAPPDRAQAVTRIEQRSTGRIWHRKPDETEDAFLDRAKAEATRVANSIAHLLAFTEGQ